MVKAKVKKKVLFLSGQWTDRGGLNKMIATVSELVSTDYDVIVCSLDLCKPNEGYALAKGVRYIEFPPSELFSVDRIVKDLGIDIFVGSNNCDIPYLDMYKKLGEVNVKTVMWNHEFFFLPYTQQALFKIAMHRKNVYKYLDAIVWPTETSATACRQYSDKVTVIGNCTYDKAIQRPRTKAHNNEQLNVVSVGRFDSRQKGIGHLLQMFSSLLKLNDDATLTIVGKYDTSMAYSDDSEESIHQLIHQLKIPKGKIKFTGEVADAGKILSEASINVMVSEAEGFGLTILEAAERSVPSAVFDGGGQADIIEDNVNGLVVPYGDHSLMAKEIVDLFANKKSFLAMRNASSEMATLYSRSIIKARWLQLFDDLLSREQFSGGAQVHSDSMRAIVIYERILLKKINDLLKYDKDVYLNHYPTLIKSEVLKFLRRKNGK